MKLTVRSTAALKLPHGKTDHIEFDDDVPGFGVRLRDGGSRGFVFQYKVGAKQRRIALGTVTAIDIGKAREIAKDLYARVRLGQDPASDKADAKIKAAETFAAIVSRFLGCQRARLRPRSYVDHEHHLLVHARVLHGMQIAKIARREIATCLASVSENSGAVTGNRVRTSLSTFFSWAMMQGLIDANPVIGTARNREQSRDRVLEPAELRIIWNALADGQYSAIVRLLALTGARAREIADLRWSEVELDKGAIMLPKERCKNNRPHVIPLSRPVRAILAAQSRRLDVDGTPRDLIFGNGQGGFSGWSNSKTELDARIKAVGKSLPHWTTHDLRRTTATQMADLGVQPHVIEATLNHQSGAKRGVAGIYNRNSYEREKTAALDLWAERLMAIVEGRDSKIVPLRQQA
jgi:integrase